MEHAVCEREMGLGRIAETEDMKGAALLLASDAGRFVSGQTLVVDGGARTYIY